MPSLESKPSLPAQRHQFSTSFSPLRQRLFASALCAIASMVGIVGIVGLMQFRYRYQAVNPYFQTDKQPFHPTVLPFRKERLNCEKNGAVWDEQECVDHDYSPDF